MNAALPAAVYEPENDEIKILFGSRDARNKMNMGFDPHIRDFMFKRSYLSLVELLEPQIRVQIKNLIRHRLQNCLEWV